MLMNFVGYGNTCLLASAILPLRSSPFICREMFGFTVWPWRCLLLPVTVLNSTNDQTNKICPVAGADPVLV
jgi:hypothetical protein